MIIVNEGINDKNLFKAVFMGGSAGSGKSFIVKSAFASKVLSPLGAKVIDSDRFFELGLEKKGLPFDISTEDPETYKKQMDVREWAKGLSATRQTMMINGMLPLVIDGTGRDFNKISEQSDLLQSIGYDTAMVLVNTSLEVALARNAARKRSVDPVIAEKMWYQIQKNIGLFQAYFGVGNFIVVDNSSTLDPDSPEGQKFDLELFKMGKKLIESPLKNPIGKDILKHLKASGGKYLSDLVKIA